MSSTPALSNLPMMGVHTLDMEPATEATKVEAPLAFVKLEQLEAPLSSASAASSPDASSMTGLITTSHSRPVKKRRSWGQELPEPTTNLPPRKRAKTEAEKEQRRIERVKRNRQAAHNSRERKRQEHDALEVERNYLAEEKQGMRDRIKELEQQLAESQKIIAQLTGQKVSTTTSIQQAPALLDSFSSPLVATESMFDPSQLSLLSSSTQHSSQSTETTPILSNSSDFTSPSTASINTPSIHLINDFELTRQSAVSPIVNGADDGLNFGGDFDLFGPVTSDSGINWEMYHGVNGDASLQDSALCAFGMDTSACFVESGEVLSEFIDLNEPSISGASAAH